MIEAATALLRYAAPVGLASLGETIGQRSGVINVGLEGAMVTAAYAGMVTTQVTGSVALGLGAAVAAGAATALVQALFVLGVRADQVVVGTAVNLFGLGLTGALYRSRYGASGALLSVDKVPRFGPGLDAVIVCWLVAVVLLGWALARSRWGLVLRATGEAPDAVEANGFAAWKLRLHGMLASGVFAGLAGGYLALGIAGSFAENMTAGRGFVALALVTFGRWRPGWVFVASLVIGYLDSLQFELQARNVGLPPQLFIALPYVAALAILVFVGKGAMAPAALGVPHERRG